MGALGSLHSWRFSKLLSAWYQRLSVSASMWPLLYFPLSLPRPPFLFHKKEMPSSRKVFRVNMTTTPDSSLPPSPGTKRQTLARSWPPDPQPCSHVRQGIAAARRKGHACTYITSHIEAYTNTHKGHTWALLPTRAVKSAILQLSGVT